MRNLEVTRRQALLSTLGAACFTLLPLSLRAETPAPTTTVETTTGKVRGLQEGDVSAFRGVPYGADTSKRRFQPAVAPQSWSGERECFRYGATAPQGSVGGGTPREVPGVDMQFVQKAMIAFRDGQVGEWPQSEDCLFLNVYTPDASPQRKRPVMFWLHGGGFAIGSGGEKVYEGHALCRRGDVVVVTINHRLGLPGYLYLGDLHEDFADSGNVGQLDQILALQWVRDNISQFGGDPDNVTIFGQSGGGAKVSTLLAMPPAKGLFHKAIVMSGAGLTMVNKEDAADLADRTLETLGIAKADVHKLQTMELATITKAANESLRSPRGGRSLAPVVDGRSLPSHPFDPIAPKISRDIPIIVGSTKDEATMFSVVDPLFGKMTEDQARDRFNKTLGERGDAAFELYRKLRPDDPPTYWVTSLMTEIRTWINSIQLAERKLAQKAAPVYMYRVDWEAPTFDGVFRAHHGIDTPFAFDNADKAPLVLGTGPEPGIVAAAMAQAWTRFAHSGDPSTTNTPWSAYDTETRKTMIFDVESHVVADPEREIREFLSG